MASKMLDAFKLEAPFVWMTTVCFSQFPCPALSTIPLLCYIMTKGRMQYRMCQHELPNNTTVRDEEGMTRRPASTGNLTRTALLVARVMDLATRLE